MPMARCAVASNRASYGLVNDPDSSVTLSNVIAVAVDANVLWTRAVAAGCTYSDDDTY